MEALMNALLPAWILGSWLVVAIVERASLKTGNTNHAANFGSTGEPFGRGPNAVAPA